ncbi:TPR-like protein, partial [Mollisia scopiformis]
MGHFHEATMALEQVQKSYLQLGIDDTVILRQLAIVYANQGRWAQAQALLTTVLNRTAYALDQVKDAVNQLLVINESLKRKYEGKLEAETIAKMERELQNMREECGERNILLLQVGMELGNIYHGQGKFSLAVDTMRKVAVGFQEQLGSDNLTTISAMQSLAGSLVMQGDLLEALETSVLVVARMGRLVGEYHRPFLQSELLVAKIQSYLGLSEKPLTIFKSVIERQTKALGSSHQDTLGSEGALARHYMDRQEHASALRIQEGVVQKSEISLGRHPFTFRSKKVLGQLLVNTGEIDGGMEMLSVAVKGSHEILGESHPETVSTRVALCSVLRMKGRFQEAEAMCTKSLETLEHKYGKGHPVTLAALSRLAEIRSDQDKQDKASELLRRAITISDSATGKDSLETVYLLSMLAKTTTNAEELQELRIRLSNSETRRIELSKKATVYDENQRAISLVSQRQWKEALDILNKLMPLSKTLFGPEDETTLTILGNVAVCHTGLGSLSWAKETIESILRTLEKNTANNSAAILNQKANLASVLMRMGKLEEARSLNESILTIMKTKYGETHPDTLRIINNLAAVNSKQDDTQQEAHALEYQLAQAMEKLAASRDTAI